MATSDISIQVMDARFLPFNCSQLVQMRYRFFDMHHVPLKFCHDLDSSQQFGLLPDDVG
jgi:hypothetical protein